MKKIQSKLFKHNTPVFALVMAVILLLTFSADAQQNRKKGKKKEKNTAAQEEVKRALKAQETSAEGLIEQKTDIESETDYVYKPMGRRDPFWDLLRGKDAKLQREAREGIAGLEIEQLVLEGITFKRGEYIALFQGPDSKPYDVKVGQSVYDGEIIKIDSESVVFKKILTIALGGTKEKTIVLRLNPEDEEKENEN